MRLQIEIFSYWHPGSALGQGAHLDALTHRDHQGLPALPGRTLKGLLRDAVSHAEQMNWYNGESWSERLFGAPASSADSGQAGLLRIGDARLPEAERHYLQQQPELIAGLYRSQFSTAVDAQSGSAQEHSLRGIELVIPLTLQADIYALDRVTDNLDWSTPLRHALPLVRAVGAHRNRGLGRAQLTLLEEVA